MNVWMRQRSAPFSASAARSMSPVRDAGERRDHRALTDVGDLADRLELALRGDREPGLDDVDAQPGELLGDLDLLGLRERDPGSLLPVAQGGVEDPDYVGPTFAFLGSSFGHRLLLGLQPGHHRAQLPSHLLELGRLLLPAEGEESGKPASASPIHSLANAPLWISSRICCISLTRARRRPRAARACSRRTRRCRRSSSACRRCRPRT